MENKMKCFVFVVMLFLCFDSLGQDGIIRDTVYYDTKYSCNDTNTIEPCNWIGKFTVEDLLNSEKFDIESTCFIYLECSIPIGIIAKEKNGNWVEIYLFNDSVETHYSKVIKKKVKRIITGSGTNILLPMDGGEIPCYYYK